MEFTGGNWDSLLEAMELSFIRECWPKPPLLTVLLALSPAANALGPPIIFFLELYILLRIPFPTFIFIGPFWRLWEKMEGGSEPVR